LMETDSILIKGKRERFLKRQTGCLKRQYVIYRENK
jgi:hypothetical protein